VTRLGTTATPSRSYGSFTRSPTGGSRSGQGPFTQLRAGIPGRRYGSFAGKAAQTFVEKASAFSIIPRTTIGDVTDVDTDLTQYLVPRLTMSSVVIRGLASSMSLRPRVTQARGAVASSSFNKAGTASAVPVVTLASFLYRPQDVEHSLIPVVTMSCSVDDTQDEIVSDHSLVPVVTLSAVVTNTGKSVSHSLIPVLTQNNSVERVAGLLEPSITQTISPIVTLGARVSALGDVDRIDINARPYGYIEITRA
jgi:hypothetical protein